MKCENTMRRVNHNSIAIKTRVINVQYFNGSACLHVLKYSNVRGYTGKWFVRVRSTQIFSLLIRKKRTCCARKAAIEVGSNRGIRCRATRRPIEDIVWEPSPGVIHVMRIQYSTAGLVNSHIYTENSPLLRPTRVFLVAKVPRRSLYYYAPARVFMKPYALLNIK